jgi:hypothetical protein
MRLRTVRGTGHHLFLTHTRLCMELFQEFLSEGSRENGSPSTVRVGQPEPNTD